MKSNRENRNTLDIIFLAIVCWSSSIIGVNKIQISFSFDSLLPASWYQKGIESSLSAWQNLLNVFEKNDNISMSLFDVLLARLYFTQFCINRIKKNKINCLPEYITYFSMVLKRIKKLVKMIDISEQNKDFVICINEMILNIQQQIRQLF